MELPCAFISACAWPIFAWPPDTRDQDTAPRAAQPMCNRPAATTPGTSPTSRTLQPCSKYTMKQVHTRQFQQNLTDLLPFSIVHRCLPAPLISILPIRSPHGCSKYTPAIQLLPCSCLAPRVPLAHNSPAPACHSSHARRPATCSGCTTYSTSPPDTSLRDSTGATCTTWTEA